MDMPDLPDEIAALRRIGPVQTWSLLVTVLGDLEAGPEAPVEGPWLTRLFQAMGIKPEALRVALHRLAKDGWIASRREGRVSQYHMTPRSMDTTRAAWERVYKSRVPSLENWHCLIFEQPVVEVDAPHIRLGPTCIAVPEASVIEVNALALPLSGRPIPDWLDQMCLPDEMWDTLRQLTALVQQIEPARLAGDPVYAAAVRALVLHQWRRLALRDGFWLHMALRPDGAARTCQSAVLAFLG